MLETIARHHSLESLTLESGPAVFASREGGRISGNAEVVVSRSSIAIRFSVEGGGLTVAKAPYGESNGSIAALDGAWSAPHVNDAGAASDGSRLFGTMALRVGGAAKDVAATRLFIAGARWEGDAVLNGRRVIAQALSRDTVSHHDHRMAIAIDGDLDDAAIETMGRACSFVSGLDVEILRVERYSADGALIAIEHRRGYRRVGRGPHSPFTGVPDADRMRAWIALVEAFPRLLKAGVPIDMIVDEISAHNQVAQINVSAQLLLLASVTAAHQRLHGEEVGPPAASRRKELERLDQDLQLGLKPEDFDRYDKLRVELLDAGFFHKPGYDTGRPQQDIKFLRDLAHVIVFRLCGYTGPFYGAERFVVRELAAASR